MHPRSPDLKRLAEKWAAVPAAERANFQPYVRELCDALGVEPPGPGGSGYEFELPVHTTDRRTGKTSTNFIDLYKPGHFILEAKHVEGDRAAERVLGAAYGQAKGYVADVPHAPPPFLLVLNVGRSLLVWDRWAGNYGGVNAARRIDLTRLAERPDEIEFLRAVWENPASLDPGVRGRRVTREVAERLARLAASLEARELDSERVARFLIRCVFTMFAEDVELLQGKPFQEAIETFRDDPAEWARAVEDLWRAMDAGTRFGIKRLLRFNGHFFHESVALPLSAGDLAVLLDAARADWRWVEPTIFGTLFTRALDPVERHRLGAEFTPREYVERVVLQAVDVPVRERWGPLLAEVRQLRERGRKKDLEAALRRLHDFHGWLRGLRFLDPACGSGNFLYVTLHLVKRVELEVLHEVEEITGHPELPLDDVGPEQFHGIEIKPWAREIAELTLWIGYHQFRMEHFKGGRQKEPLLTDTGNLELRDAVLAYDEVVEDPSRSRPDPTPRRTHAVTGKLVPDPSARLPYFVYRNARPAPWPQADFIIGNPPYMGARLQREVFGDGYVDALRNAYPSISDNADYVMYWWWKSANAIASGGATRAGLITTNTITQSQNRSLIQQANAQGVSVVWAVPDHPWVDEAGAADVRVAMTVLARDYGAASLVFVDEAGKVVREISAAALNADLTTHADVARAAEQSLLANAGLSFRGFQLIGTGFVLSPDEAAYLLSSDPQNAEIIKQYVNGRDLAQRSRGVHVIDFGLMTEDEARRYPVLFDIVRTRVKPEREANNREAYRRYWWRFGEPQPSLREAVSGLSYFIVTPVTSKHRHFQYFHSGLLPDQGLIAIATADSFVLGVLSSSIHIIWALAAGGRLGVGNDPRYNKTKCFDPFPFPDPPKHLRERIGLVAEALDQHRKDALARDERVTMTGMYNVVEKLRSGEPLTPKERDVHEIAACGVLRDLHDELDRLVAEAYGWPWPMEREEILERLVALHDERVEEEKRGTVRWLRPEYQAPRFGKEAAPAPELALPDEAPAAEAASAPRPWPATALEQIAALKALVSAAPASPDEAAAAFEGARPELVRRHLETLEMVGEVRRNPGGRYEAVAEPL